MTDRMRPRHVPGPWQLILDDTGGKDTGLPLCVDTVKRYDGMDGKTIVGYHTGFIPRDRFAPMTEEEIIGNAMLVAHAPTMFDYIEERARAGDERAQKIMMSICAQPDYDKASYSGEVK